MADIIEEMVWLFSVLIVWNILLLILNNCETRKTINTRNISGMLLCCKEKALGMGDNLTVLQATTLISLLVCPDLSCDWSQHKHSWNILGVHDIQNSTVI